jgi:hypothetical protein
MILAAIVLALQVTQCEVSLRRSTTPGPALYQYRARISVFNPSTQPVQFARVDVVGRTRDGAFGWAPVGAYFAFVPPHNRNPRAGPSQVGEPLILSRVMRNGLDDDRPTHAFTCQVRAPGAESPARPIED